MGYINKSAITDRWKKPTVNDTPADKISMSSPQDPSIVFTSSTSSSIKSYLVPASGTMDLIKNDQIQPQPLPQFLPNKSKNLVILSKSSPDITNVSVPQPKFTIIPPSLQYAPEISPKTIAISNKSTHQYPHDASTPFTIRNASGQAIDATRSLVDVPIEFIPDYSMDSTSPMLDDATSLQQTYLDEVLLELPFDMKDSASSANHEDANTSKITPQYILNNSGILSNATTVILLPSPTDAIDSSSAHLQSSNDSESPYSITSLNYVNSDDGPTQMRSCSETASVYSMDSGHPNDSPQYISDVASQYSGASPNSYNSNESPGNLQHYHDIPLRRSSVHLGHSNELSDHAQDAKSTVQYSATASNARNQKISLVDVPSLQRQKLKEMALNRSLNTANSSPSEFPVQLQYLNNAANYYSIASTNHTNDLAAQNILNNPEYTISTTELNDGPNTFAIPFNKAVGQCSNNPNVEFIAKQSHSIEMEFEDYAFSSVKAINDSNEEQFNKPDDLVHADSHNQRSPLTDHTVSPAHSFTDSSSPFYEFSSVTSAELSPPIDIQDYFNVASQYSEDSGIVSSSGESPPQSSNLSSDDVTSIYSSLSKLSRDFCESPVQLTHGHGASVSIVSDIAKQYRPDEQPNFTETNGLDSLSGMNENEKAVQVEIYANNAPSDIIVEFTDLNDPFNESIELHCVEEIVETTNFSSPMVSIASDTSTIAPTSLPSPEHKTKSQPPPTHTRATRSKTVNILSTTTTQTQCSTSSGILQKLVDAMPTCAVMLERIDYRNTIRNSGTIQDLNTVQNSIPKQYIIDSRNSKSNRIRKIYPKNYPENIDELFRKNCKMNCEACDQAFETFFDICSHFRRTHKRPGFVRCCRRKFFQRGQLLEHIQTHPSEPQYRYVI